LAKSQDVFGGRGGAHSGQEIRSPQRKTKYRGNDAASIKNEAGTSGKFGKSEDNSDQGEGKSLGLLKRKKGGVKEGGGRKKKEGILQGSQEGLNTVAGGNSQKCDTEEKQSFKERRQRIDPKTPKKQRTLDDPQTKFAIREEFPGDLSEMEKRHSQRKIPQKTTKATGKIRRQKAFKRKSRE